jgi:hypothetical protein
LNDCQDASSEFVNGADTPLTQVINQKKKSRRPSLFSASNESGSVRVNRKSDPRKNVVVLNLTPEPMGKIWHLNPSGFGSGSGVHWVL